MLQHVQQLGVMHEPVSADYFRLVACPEKVAELCLREQDWVSGGLLLFQVYG